MGRPPDAMYALIYKAGGIKPAARVRSSRQSVAEREEISRGLAAGESCRAIAARLGRAPSTITREATAMASHEAIYRSTARPNSTPSPSSSTHVLARPSSS